MAISRAENSPKRKR